MPKKNQTKTYMKNSNKDKHLVHAPDFGKVHIKFFTYLTKILMSKSQTEPNY